MLKTIIRREHKNEWERRVALTPAHTKALREQGLNIVVENSPERIFANEAYTEHGIPMMDTPKYADFVVGIKEPPVTSIQPGQVHLAFSHIIKGQSHSMRLLQKFIDEKATLFDYERFIDENGKRTISFGRFAGIAGAVDTLYVLGRKFALKEVESDICLLKQTIEYDSYELLKAACAELDLQKGEPVRVLIVGTGNVGHGSEEVCQWLNLPKVDVDVLLSGGEFPEASWYAVAKNRHINARIDGKPFNRADFIEHGTKYYASTFDALLGKFNVLLQTPYWTEKYPKHLDAQRMKQYEQALPLVIGDISCDIDGSLSCTKKESSVGNPAFTYNVQQETIKDGISVDGVTVMAIDNLPCELSKDASEYFSNILKNYMHDLMHLDLSQDFNDLNLPILIKNAMIVYKGELTPNYGYLQSFLDEHQQNG